MKNILLVCLFISILTQTAFAQNNQHSCGADSVHNPNLAYGTVSDIDGNVYKTIAIGNQVWMAENLKTSRYLNGDLIPNLTSNSGWVNAYNTQTGASCWYNNDSISNNCPYGKLYNWHVVNDIRKVCPTDWHVSTAQEWIDLSLYIDPIQGGINGGTFVGKPLKSIGSQYWLNNSNTVSDNATGFSALSTGFRENSGTYLQKGIGTGFWTSTGAGLENQAFYNALRNDAAAIVFSYGPKETGFCIRCINDVLLSTSIDLIEKNPAINVFPNPVTTELNISIPFASNFAIQLFNSFGVRILETRNQSKIDVSQLAKGIYYLKVTDNNTIHSQKIIIQ